MAFYGGGTVQGAVRLRSRTSPGLSAAGEGRIYFDQGTNTFLVSENGGAYVPLSGDAETLAETLAAGNTTSGNDIVVSNGDQILAETELNLVGGSVGDDGSDIDLTGGQAANAGNGGSINLIAGSAVDGESGSVNIDAGAVSGAGGGGGVYIGTDSASEIQIQGTLFTSDGAEQRVAGYNQALWLTAETHDADTEGKPVFVWASDGNGVAPGGFVDILGGAGGDGGGAGGWIYITGRGATGPGDNDGGSIELNVGSGVGLGSTGNIQGILNGGEFRLTGGEDQSGPWTFRFTGDEFRVADDGETGNPVNIRLGYTGIEATYHLDIQEGGSVGIHSGNNRQIDIVSQGSTSIININAAQLGLATNETFTRSVYIGTRGTGGEVAVHGGESVLDPSTTFSVYSANVNLSGGGSMTIGNEDEGNGLILVQPGFTSIADGSSLAAGLEFGPLYYDTKNGTYVQFGNSVYIDGNGVNNVIRAGDGFDVETVFPYTATDPGDTYNLAGAGAVDTDALQPGTVTVRIFSSSLNDFAEVTDDGAGGFAASTALPAGGTVNYAARTLTGTTGAMKKGSRVEIVFQTANTAGETMTFRSGDASGTAAGGSLTIRSGAGGTTSGNSGALSIDAGAVTSGTAGAISVGTTNASAVTVGRSGATTTVAGVADMTGAVGLGAVTSVSGNTTLDATNAIVLVNASGGPVTITLPAAAGSTRRHYTIKKIDSSANAVTIDGDGAETIDGATTQSLAVQYDALQVVSNGTAWFVV